jgi:hypothetical protein
VKNIDLLCGFYRLLPDSPGFVPDSARNPEVLLIFLKEIK